MSENKTKPVKPKTTTRKPRAKTTTVKNTKKDLPVSVEPTTTPEVPAEIEQRLAEEGHGVLTPEVVELLNDPTQRKEGVYRMLGVSSTMTDYANVIRSIVRTERNFAGLHNYSLFEKFVPDEEAIPKIYKEIIKRGYILIGSSDYFSIFVDKAISDPTQTPRCYLNFDQNRYEFLFFGQGDKKALEDLMKIFKKHLVVKVEEADSINEFYLEGSGLGVRPLSIDFDKTNSGHDCFYPWLAAAGLTLDEFVDDYLKSDESILILHGLAGTGKSTLINEMMKRTKGHIAITSDNVLMIKAYNSIINKLKEQDYSMIILEDADILIGTDREGGNVAIAPFLNIADGAGREVSSEKPPIKIIFTTNKVDEKDIDEALLRAGRCYGIVTFGKLNMKEAQKVASVVNPNWKPITGVTEYTLAEIAKQRSNRIGNDKVIVRKFGIGFQRGNTSAYK